ncbi:hypothetical protein [Sodalis-like endosymbiont of Proechinophthirus fluctus]|nr:hypothetical protein [Sodalis-like endosymbiont of Proechinophthirus fluctus]
MMRDRAHRETCEDDFAQAFMQAHFVGEEHHMITVVLLLTLRTLP